MAWETLERFAKTLKAAEKEREKIGDHRPMCYGVIYHQAAEECKRCEFSLACSNIVRANPWSNSGILSAVDEVLHEIREKEAVVIVNTRLKRSVRRGVTHGEIWTPDICQEVRDELLGLASNSGSESGPLGEEGIQPWCNRWAVIQNVCGGVQWVRVEDQDR